MVLPVRGFAEGSFAMLCGTAPIPASSGRTDRHRLSTGGDRQANHALYMIIRTRLATYDRTRTHLTRRTHQGLPKKDTVRCLKRSLTHEIFKALTSTNTPKNNHDATA